MKRRVVVTGIGAVTSLGCKVDELWTRICNGESGVRPLERLSVANYRVRFGGEIRNWSADGYIDAKDVKRFDRFVQFAQVSGVNAVRDSGIDFSKEDPWRCGVDPGLRHRRPGNDRDSAPAAARQGARQGLGLHHPQADRQRGQRPAFHPVRTARTEPGGRHRLRQRHQRHRRRLTS